MQIKCEKSIRKFKISNKILMHFTRKAVVALTNIVHTITIFPKVELG